MKVLFYNDFYKKRLQKIINIFGVDWFAGKKILDLGACHGEIGLELLRLGADVTFADCRQEHLDGIREKLDYYNLDFPTILLDQEKEWDLNEKFDLVLHLGVLYNLQNWKQDLACVMKHTSLCILESSVTPAKVPDYTKKLRSGTHVSQYRGLNQIWSHFCQESVEATLKNLDCKLIRFDNKDLNSEICWDSGRLLVQFMYDWDEDNKFAKYGKNNLPVSVYHRRFWLIVK